MFFSFTQAIRFYNVFMSALFEYSILLNNLCDTFLILSVDSFYCTLNVLSRISAGEDTTVCAFPNKFFGSKVVANFLITLFRD